LALCDKHLELLDAVRDNKSGVREEKKIREFVESLVAEEGFTAKQKLVISTWYHQLNKLPASADTNALLDDQQRQLVLRVAETLIHYRGDCSRCQDCIDLAF
jgi:hypothetical protein